MSSKLPTVLMVDDSATTRAMIKRVIQMTDVPVGELLQAGHGGEALELMKTRNIDLVLADLNMPVMDGTEMITAMRSTESLRHIAVVVISAQPDDEQIKTLKKMGVSEYLPKPFTPESVRTAIGPILTGIVYAPEPLPPVPQSAFNLSLAEALTEALETMAFVSPELFEDNNAANDPQMRIARVIFTGANFKGSLSLSAPKQFGVMVAENCAVDDAEGKADDALKELANVTCGIFLKKRIGGAVGFHLAPPVMAAPGSAEASAESDCITVKADGFVVSAHVTPEHPVASAA